MTPLLACIIAILLLVGGQPQSDIGTAEWALSGSATWYDAPSSRDAAAGPLLREQLGKHWRGKWVSVCHGSKCVTVQLTDWCLCSKGRRLVDLDDRAFITVVLGHPPVDTEKGRAEARRALGKGVLEVVVSPVDGQALPATDTE